MPNDLGQRFCPVCGEETTALFCPNDRTPTVIAQGFAKHPRAYEVGDIIAGRYQIDGALGAGGFAAVYSAEHMGTAQKVAVKLMAFDMTGEEGSIAVRRFFREARITAGLHHPNTVRVFDVGQDEQGPLFIAMELLRGESLEALLKRRFGEERGLTERETLDISIQVLASLSEAHEGGLVHRDLKPANIFLNEAPDGSTVVKVLDFGIARTADSSLTLGGNMPGTPPFMSPEQCRGDELDGRSDLYSLAVLMFLCVCARLPFAHQNVLKLMRMHSFEPAPDPRSFDGVEMTDELATVLLNTLAKAPSDRPKTAAVMMQLLEQVRDGNFAESGMSIIPVEEPLVAFSTIDLMDMPTRDSTAFRAPRIDPATVDIDFGDDDGDTQASPSDHVAKGPAPTPAAQPAATPPAESSAPAPAAVPGAAKARSDDDALSSAAASIPAASSPAASAAPAATPAAASAASAVPAAAPSAPQATSSSGAGRWIAVVVIALLLVGGAVAFMGSGDDPGPGHSEARPAPVKPAQADAQPAKKARSEKELAAAVAAKMAAKADDVDKALDYAREAVRLAPANAKYKQLLERIEAKKATALPPPTPSAAAPPPPPAPAPAPAPAAAAKPARKTHRATSKPAPKPGGRVSPAILEE